MKKIFVTMAKFSLFFSFCLMEGLVIAQNPAQPSVPTTGRGIEQPSRGGLSLRVNDPRVQNRTYRFTETGEELPYAVFVSSKITKDKKAPLVIALHGMNGTPGTFVRGDAIEQAEAGGYILVGPMGYNSVGSFGMPMSFGARGATTPPANRNSTTPSVPNQSQTTTQSPTAQADPQTGRGTGRGMGGGIPTVGGTAETDPAKVTEYSEKDAMNVLEMIRKEYNIDDKRIYLMGHSLGGGGALYLSEKYASIWAGVAALAPASFGFQPTEQSKIKSVPILIMQGDADELVRPAMSDQLAERLKALNMNFEYIKKPGLDHSTIIMGSMPEVFAFFSKHTKP
jgi:pimeloyl-ACP methyl ester carboxylesterase